MIRRKGTDKRRDCWFRSDNVVLAEKKNRVENVRLQFFKNIMDRQATFSGFAVNKEIRSIGNFLRHMYKTSGQSPKGVAPNGPHDRSYKTSPYFYQGACLSEKRIQKWRAVEKEIQRLIREEEGNLMSNLGDAFQRDNRKAADELKRVMKALGLDRPQSAQAKELLHSEKGNATAVSMRRKIRTITKLSDGVEQQHAQEDQETSVVESAQQEPCIEDITEDSDKDHDIQSVKSAEVICVKELEDTIKREFSRGLSAAKEKKIVHKIRPVSAGASLQRHVGMDTLIVPGSSEQLKGKKNGTVSPGTYSSEDFQDGDEFLVRYIEPVKVGKKGAHATRRKAQVSLMPRPSHDETRSRPRRAVPTKEDSKAAHTVPREHERRRPSHRDSIKVVSKLPLGHVFNFRTYIKSEESKKAASMHKKSPAVVPSGKGLQHRSSSHAHHLDSHYSIDDVPPAKMKVKSPHQGVTRKASPKGKRPQQKHESSRRDRKSVVGFSKSPGGDTAGKGKRTRKGAVRKVEELHSDVNTLKAKFTSMHIHQETSERKRRSEESDKKQPQRLIKSAGGTPTPIEEDYIKEYEEPKEVTLEWRSYRTPDSNFNNSARTSNVSVLSDCVSDGSSNESRSIETGDEGDAKVLIPVMDRANLPRWQRDLMMEAPPGLNQEKQSYHVIVSSKSQREKDLNKLVTEHVGDIRRITLIERQRRLTARSHLLMTLHKLEEANRRVYSYT